MANEPARKMSGIGADEDACALEGIRCSYSYNPCPSCGVVTSIFGSVKIRRKGSSSWCDAKEGVAIGAGDNMKICGKGKEKGRARVVYYNAGITQDTGPDTSFKISQMDLAPLPEATKRVVDTQFNGSLHYVIERGSEAVEISFGPVVAVVRNAEFSVDAKGSPESAEYAFKAFAGSIVLQAAETVKLSEGQSCTFNTETGAFSPPAAFAKEKEDAWWAGLTSDYAHD